jgi:hypothetical protein
MARKGKMRNVRWEEKEEKMENNKSERNERRTYNGMESGLHCICNTSISNFVQPRQRDQC